MFQEPETSPNHKIPMLNSAQPELYFDLRLTKPGPHIILMNYVTPQNEQGSAQISVSARTQYEQVKGMTTLYPCDYTIICKHVVLDKHGQVAVFNFDSNYVSLILKVSLLHLFIKC